MQYSKPWSCSMGGWLMSSGFASAISPDVLCLLDRKEAGNRTGRALSLASQSQEHGLFAKDYPAGCRTPIRLLIPWRWLSSAGPLTAKREEAANQGDTDETSLPANCWRAQGRIQLAGEKKRLQG